MAFADFVEGPTPREARSGVANPLLETATIRETAAGATLGPRGPIYEENAACR